MNAAVHHSPHEKSQPLGIKPPAEHRVAVCLSERLSYPEKVPFNPPEQFPEFAEMTLANATDPENAVYAAVRESLHLLGLDQDRFGTPQWNPLSTVVLQGDSVLIKPNWVSHKHELNESWQQIITHGAVLRAVIDYVQLALRGKGSIWLADGPMLNSDFDEICRRTGAAGLKQFYATQQGACPVELIDLRSIFFETRDDVVVARSSLPGDPRGGVAVDLGPRSALYRYQGEGRYYGADYDTAEVNEHHHGDKHEYQLSGSAMQADVIIDVPKLKTHHKVGVTLALKGVVGLNTNRNWLPHRTQGTPQQGGDQFAHSGSLQKLEQTTVRWFEQASLRFPRVVPPLYRLAKRIGRTVFGASHQTIRGGGWHGNDTLWRMVHDINRALQYADTEGNLHVRPQRRRFCVVDGIVAGEGTGPVFADSRAAGVILSGSCPAVVDTVAAELIGFDHTHIPSLAQAFEPHPLPLTTVAASDIQVTSNTPAWCGSLAEMAVSQPFSFAPPLGWENYIERTKASSSTAVTVTPAGEHSS